jgi:hypothetical protein
MRIASLAKGALLALLTSSSSCAEATHRSLQPVDPIEPAEEQREKERASRGGTGAPVSAEPVAVDRAEVARAESLDPASLPTSLRRAIAGVDLPVLLPAPEALGEAEPYERATLIHRSGWYSISLRLEGASLVFTGNRLAHARPEAALEASPDASAPRLGRTHGIVDVSFVRFGVAYGLHVECAAPSADPRCLEDDFALGLVGAMRVSDGAP